MSDQAAPTDFLRSFLEQSLPISLLKICILIAVAYLLSRGPLFRRLLLQRTSLRDKLTVFAFFAVLILAEVWMNPSRFRQDVPTGDFWARQDMSVGLVAAVTAGLLVGPEMGFAVGFLAWLTSSAVAFWDAKGAGPAFSALYMNPALAAGLGGLLGGWIKLFRPTPRLQRIAGFLVGVLSQATWLSIGLFKEITVASMSLPLLAARWSAAILSGGLSVLFFLWIIGDVKAQQERVGSLQIQRALGIAIRTLPFLRQGLNAESAGPIAEIVHRVAEVGAVALTDGRAVVAHVGAGADHHRAGDRLPAGLSGDGLETHERVLGPSEMGCDRPDCPLTSGVFSPLIHEGAAIGGVILYDVDGREMNPETMRLGVGLAQFFSNYQVELAELERQTQAVSQAELKALQSQVHPHFLFNVLNTLAALCEIDPGQAGKLTVRLATFLRRSLRESPAPLIPLREEMENVRSYLEIEKARFQDRLTVLLSIPDDVLDSLVPSFGLQILVENAILHGMSKKSGPGRVWISSESKAGRLWCVVQDEGPGFTAQRQAEVFSGSGRASGLRVLRERGRRLMGRRFRLRIIGKKGAGTTVVMAVPLAEAAAGPSSEPSASEARASLASSEAPDGRHLVAGGTRS